jgi:hypothetical protein
MPPNRPGGEYDSLRAEILLLQERAHEVWKWGIVSMLALLGVLISTITGLDADSGIFDVVQRYAVLVAAGFLILGAGIALMIVLLSTHIRYVISRIGAYLAVFHDGAGPDGRDMTRLGWHAWSRVEKAVGGLDSLGKLPLTRHFRFHGTPRTFTLLFLFYGTVLVVLFTAIDPDAATALTCLTFAALVLVAAAVEYAERKTGHNATAWSVRWVQSAGGSDEQIQEWLAMASLAESRTRTGPPFAPPSPPSAHATGEPSARSTPPSAG